MHTHSCMYTPSHCHTHVHTKHTHVRTFTAFCNAPFLPALQENLTNPAAYVCSTVVTAFKCTITDQPQPIDVMLKACIGDFLKTLGDTELVGTSGDVKMCVCHTFCFVCRFAFLDAVPVRAVYVHLFRLCGQWFLCCSIWVCVCACQFVEVCPPHPPQSARRVALVSFNSAAHNKPVLTADLLDILLPILYSETKVRVSSCNMWRTG